MSPQEQIVARFAPTGTLRAAINLGNPTLAGSDPASGVAHGVSVDLARELGRRLGVAVELLTVELLQRLLCTLSCRHFDEGEATRPTGLAIHDDRDAGYFASVGSKRLSE